VLFYKNTDDIIKKRHLQFSRCCKYKPLVKQYYLMCPSCNSCNLRASYRNGTTIKW